MFQVEVCREFQRGQCTRSDQECKFAHPPPHVDVQQGRVTACYDSIKVRPLFAWSKDATANFGSVLVSTGPMRAVNNAFWYVHSDTSPDLLLLLSGYISVGEQHR